MTPTAEETVAGEEAAKMEPETTEPQEEKREIEVMMIRSENDGDKGAYTCSIGIYSSYHSRGQACPYLGI